MRRLTLLMVFAVAAVSFVAFRPAATTDASAVEGVWKTVHVTMTNDEGTEENEITQPSLMIFTGNHWAAFRISGGQEPREMLPEDPTDEQRLAAFRRFNATAGTYEVKGNEIHTKLLMHRNPNAMAEQNEGSAPFEVDGDTLYRTFTNANNGTVWRVKYMRVE
jgi:hypothetical protein